MVDLILQVIVLIIFRGFFAEYMIRYRRLRSRSYEAVENGVAGRTIGTRAEAVLRRAGLGDCLDIGQMFVSCG